MHQVSDWVHYRRSRSEGRQQLINREWFAKKRGGSRGHRCLLLSVGEKARNDNYFHLGIDAQQGFDDGDSAYNRHHYVGDHCCNFGLSMNVSGKTFRSTAGGYHAIPESFESFPDNAPDCRLIIND